MLREPHLLLSRLTRLFCPFVSPYMSHDQYSQIHSPDASLSGRACYSTAPSQILDSSITSCRPNHPVSIWEVVYPALLHLVLRHVPQLFYYLAVSPNSFCTLGGECQKILQRRRL